MLLTFSYATGPAGASWTPGSYGAVGFSYGGAEGSSSGSDSEAKASSSEDDRDDDAKRQDTALDGLAANVGIENFSVMLRRAEQQEEDEALGRVPRKKCACCH